MASTTNTKPLVIASPHHPENPAIATRKFEKKYPDVIKYTIMPCTDDFNEEFDEWCNGFGTQFSRLSRNEENRRAWLKEAVRRVLVNPEFQRGVVLCDKQDNLRSPNHCEYGSGDESDGYYLHPCDAGSSQKYWKNEDEEENDEEENENEEEENKDENKDENENENEGQNNPDDNEECCGANGDIYNNYKQSNLIPQSSFHLVHRRISRLFSNYDTAVIQSLYIIKDDFIAQCNFFKALSLTGFLNPETLPLHNRYGYLPLVTFFGPTVLWLGVKGGILSPFQGFSEEEFNLPREIELETLSPSQKDLHQAHFGFNRAEGRIRGDEDFYMEILAIFKYTFAHNKSIKFDLVEANTLFSSLFSPSPQTPDGIKMTQDALNLFSHTYNGDLNYLVKVQEVISQYANGKSSYDHCYRADDLLYGPTCIACTVALTGCSLLHVCMSMAKVLLNHKEDNNTV